MNNLANLICTIIVILLALYIGHENSLIREHRVNSKWRP